MKTSIIVILLSGLTTYAAARQTSLVWNPDKGTHYTNPVINADYSDPDVCRVGNDFYMTSSSFACFPGLQILHSTDLVNWKLAGAALRNYPGEDWIGNVQHGKGVWAPAIRHHDGEFYIYWGDPDKGIYMVKTSDPCGVWSDPVCVVKAKGFIDPCPLWDEDGKAYLSHGCAGSRAGLKSVLFVAPMSSDGSRLLGPSRIVYDGHQTQPTIEGTKFYKRNGYYYIFSPAGGVSTGWQTVLRSKSPWGPFEERVVMAQGSSDVNGPHQGAWVDTPSGEHWFLHFQDKDAYGRVVHLQPMTWTSDNWPVIGTDPDGDGVGEPVRTYRKPALASSGKFQPADTDEFNSRDLGLQWQWSGIPSPYWSYVDGEYLKLYSVQQDPKWKNMSYSTNLLLQKTPADRFNVTAKVRFVPSPSISNGEESCGLVLMGQDYAALKMVSTSSGTILQYVECHNALKGSEEDVVASVPLESVPLPVPYSASYMSSTVPPVKQQKYMATDIYLRIKVAPRYRKGNVPDLTATFWYSHDGITWTLLPAVFLSGQSGKNLTTITAEDIAFTAKPGKWIGAKFGFFCNRSVSNNDGGWMQVDWIRVD